MTLWNTTGRLLIAGLALTGGIAAGQEEAAQPPAAEAPKAELPSPESLFERHLEAIGGKDKIFAITSRTFTGSIKVYVGGEKTPRQSGILRVQAKAPDLLVQEVIFPGISTTVKYFDGKAGWTVVQDQPAVAMSEIEIERFAVGARFYTEADYANHYKSYETVEKQEIDGDSVFIVRVEYHSGRTEAIFFSEKSGLIVGVAGMRDIGPDQQVEFRRSYEEYTDFGSGVLAAKRIREVVGNQMFELAFTSIETGTEFPEIERPEGIPDADLSSFRP